MWTAFAVFAGLLGSINLVQVFTGRQLVRPSASRRSALEIRRQSAAAAVMMLGACLVGLGMFWGALFTVIGCVALQFVRTRAPKH
ncbi:hypothetical protein ACIRVF_25000 [Kitasatospora sp. NPDC101157]|uniref:hypothetical protein n=1 Tax=Kitasatospora sp. NPDC101157 TaxID=3364098 RepID=UPI00382E2925